MQIVLERGFQSLRGHLNGHVGFTGFQLVLPSSELLTMGLPLLRDRVRAGGEVHPGFVDIQAGAKACHE